MRYSGERRSGRGEAFRDDRSWRRAPGVEEEVGLVAQNSLPFYLRKRCVFFLENANTSYYVFITSGETTFLKHERRFFLERGFFEEPYLKLWRLSRYDIERLIYGPV